MVAALIALAAPALASAQTAETPAEPPAAGNELAAAPNVATEAPAPGDETGTAPTEPPASSSPAEPTPAPESPTAAPAPAEATPTTTPATPATSATPVMPAPDPPRSRAAEVTLGPVVVDAAAAAPARAAPVVVTGGPGSPPAALDAGALGDPGAPPAAGAPTGAAERDVPLPPGADARFTLASLTPAAAVPAGARGSALPSAAGAAERPGPDPFQALAEAAGPLPGASSLLSALAAYVIPGGGALPGTPLLLLVQLGVILALLVAPRPGLRERVLAAARLGPHAGHRTLLARPG